MQSGTSCYLPSFACNSGPIGPHVHGTSRDGSRELIAAELGNEWGGRASLKHLGSQTRWDGDRENTVRPLEKNTCPGPALAQLSREAWG